MKINLSPQRRDDTLVLEKMGDVLTINGDDLDLSVITEGSTYPDATEIHPFLSGSITRENGELELTFILPHGKDAPEEVLFPEPLIVTVDGPITLPGDSNE